MEREELIERLKGYEWTDVEFKEARRAVPKDAYETVSAFANTEGGHLVFGVRQSGGGFEIVGILEVDKVQNEFLTALRQQDKISAILDIRRNFTSKRTRFCWSSIFPRQPGETSRFT